MPLTELPAAIGNLTSLRFLSLESCQKLTRLPEALFALAHLETLSLHYTGADLARLRETFPASVFGNFSAG